MLGWCCLIPVPSCSFRSLAEAWPTCQWTTFSWFNYVSGRLFRNTSRALPWEQAHVFEVGHSQLTRKQLKACVARCFFVSFILMIICYTFPSAQDKIHEHGTAIDALDGFCVTLMIEWAWSTGSRWLHSLSTNISNSPCSETPRGS